MISSIQWIINLIVQLITILIIVQVFLSYFLSPYHPFRQTLDRILIPIYMKIRRYIPPLGVVDLSPFILLILVQLAGRIIIGILNTLVR